MHINVNTLNFSVKVSVTADSRKSCLFYRSSFTHLSLDH